MPEISAVEDAADLVVDAAASVCQKTETDRGERANEDDNGVTADQQAPT